MYSIEHYGNSDNSYEKFNKYKYDQFYEKYKEWFDLGIISFVKNIANVHNNSDILDNNIGAHSDTSSVPIPDLGYDDAEVLLHWEKLRVKDLQEQVLRVEKRLNDVTQENNQLKLKQNENLQKE